MIYNVLSILKEIIAFNSEVEVFFLSHFPANKAIQDEQKLNDSEKKQLNRALEIREKFGFSFWEAVTSTFVNSPNPNYSLLENSTRHNPNKNLVEFTDIFKLEKFLDRNQHENLALLSTVKTKNGYMHIPMIDFHIPPSEYNIATVDEVLKKLELNHGYLINSGKSYHFMSKKFVTQDHLDTLLAKMIFFSPIIDRNWVAHQLIEKKCALRITRGNKSQLKMVKYYP